MDNNAEINTKVTEMSKNMVTKKFLIIALVVTVLINVILSAGAMGLISRNRGPGMGRPDSGFFQDGSQNGGSFTPPEGEQNTESGD